MAAKFIARPVPTPRRRNRSRQATRNREQQRPSQFRSCRDAIQELCVVLQREDFDAALSRKFQVNVIRPGGGGGDDPQVFRSQKNLLVQPHVQ